MTQFTESDIREIRALVQSLKSALKGANQGVDPPKKGITKAELDEFRRKTIESVKDIEPEIVLRRVTAPPDI